MTLLFYIFSSLSLSPSLLLFFDVFLLFSVEFFFALYFCFSYFQFSVSFFDIYINCICKADRLTARITFGYSINDLIRHCNVYNICISKHITETKCKMHVKIMIKIKRENSQAVHVRAICVFTESLVLFFTAKQSIVSIHFHRKNDE